MAHKVLLFPEGQEVQPKAETLGSLQSFERGMGIMEGDDERSVTVHTVCSRVISVMGVLHCAYSYKKIRCEGETVWLEYLF